MLFIRWRPAQDVFQKYIYTPISIYIYIPLVLRINDDGPEPAVKSENLSHRRSVIITFIIIIIISEDLQPDDGVKIIFHSSSWHTATRENPSHYYY